MELLRKITIRTMGHSLEELKKWAAAAKKGEKRPLVRIVGETSGAKTGQHPERGTHTKLLGQFVGTNLVTGEVFQSGQCILPEFVGAPLGAAVASGDKAQFAVEVGQIADASSVVGYTFSVKPLMETKPSDQMQQLMKLAGINPDAQPAKLPAPAKTAKTKAKAGA